eukprot:TRINITY_DN3687_c0_g1_i3.p1 TRINITY_DN3687_c0_g1~~TRINITY_DN3687_c0_g1_i3.p1  ORF type:complete len:165 (-),score=33.78 TRINITY_DN3687_c0_g1_i3:230-724(-)
MPRLDEHGLPPVDGEQAPESVAAMDQDEEESDDEVDESAQDEWYDENMDEKDEAWVRQHRSGGGHRSDATLNCPCCMTTLCYDCQRHSRYHHQFRAMFTVNCKVVKSEQLVYHEAQRSLQANDACVEGEVYSPVRCEHCNTEVGVYDQDEIFHFFNVAPTTAMV